MFFESGKAFDEERIQRIVSEFNENGYAHLGRVASDSALDALRERADDLMLGRVTYPGMFFQRDTETGKYDDLEFGLGYQGPSLNYRKIEKLELDPVYRAWLENPLFQRIVSKVIPGDVTIYRAVLMNKKAQGGTPLPWHQDGGKFWGLERDPEIQIWTALDDAPVSSGCVEVIPKSHLDGLVTPLGGVIPRHHVSARDAERHALPIPAKAGDVVLIHNYVWHRSGVNITNAPRRAFSVCYMNASIRCLRKKRAPRQFVRVFERLE